MVIPGLEQKNTEGTSLCPYMEGKRNIFFATFSPHEHKKLQYTRTSNANCFKFFHHVDLPDYLIFAQDGRAERCTRMPEARAELLY